MNIIKRVAQNTSVIILDNILDILCNFLISISLARYFGQNGFGKLSFLAIYLFFLSSVDNLWLRPILIRQMSIDEKRSAYIIGNGLLIKAAISVFAVILFWITIWLLNPPTEVIILAFFASLRLLLQPIFFCYETILQVKLKMVYSVVFSLFSKILTLGLIYVIVFYKGTLFHFYLLSFIPSLIFLLQIKHYSEKIIKPKFEFDFLLWRKIFKASWPLGLSALFIFIYNRLDQIMLFYFGGPDKVGLYSAATRLAESFTIIPVALMISALPLMSKYYEPASKGFENIYQLSFKYLLIFIVPTATYISIFSVNLTNFFYGNKFLSSALPLSILIWAEVFVFLGTVNQSILIASGRQRIDPIFTGASAIVNIILNLIFIPKYSFVGAAVASLISYSVGPMLGYFIPTTRLYSYHMFYFSLKPLVASMIMACFIILIRKYFLVSMVISPFIYLLALYYIKGISQDDIRTVKSIASTQAVA